jgi:tetratricopeptide (TPR) repeat protein
MSSPDQPPAEEQLFDTGEFEAGLFWQRHRRTILLGAAIAVVGVIAIVAWLINSYNARIDAGAAFANAASPGAWREVIAKYPDSKQAADAYFLLAESQREQGDVAESTETYRKFLTVFPKHSLAGGARLGIAENLEISGKTAEAVTALKEAQEGGAGDYAAPYAALLEGRIYLRQGRLDEARRIFSTLVSTYSRSPAARAAGAQLDEIMPLLSPESAKVAQ